MHDSFLILKSVRCGLEIFASTIPLSLRKLVKAHVLPLTSNSPCFGISITHISIFTTIGVITCKTISAEK